MRWWVVGVVAIFLACGPQVSDGGTSADASGGAGAHPASTSGAADATTGGVTGGVTTATSPDASTGVRLDVAPLPPDVHPLPAHCDGERAPGTVVVERMTTPDRTEVNIEYAELAFDLCSGDPSVVLYTDQTLWKWRFFRLWDDVPRSWDGYVDAEFHDFEGAERAGIEFLEPFEDDDPSHANADVWLNARVTVEGGGWDVSVVVDVPDCGAYDCYCPCE